MTRNLPGARATVLSVVRRTDCGARPRTVCLRRVPRSGRLRGGSIALIVLAIVVPWSFGTVGLRAAEAAGSPFLVEDINKTPSADEIGFSEDAAQISNLVILGDSAGNLWRSDGSQAGTVVIRRMYASQLTSLGDYVYFLGTIGPRFGLWRTDGTEEGTVPLIDEVWFGGLSRVGNKLFFVESYPETRLWKTDGTAQGTRPVAAVPGQFHSMTDVGGMLFFVATDAQHGEEIWISDGTTEGTHIFLDLNPGPAPSSPRIAGVVGDRLFFQADDGIHGSELWSTTGTVASTSLLADIRPGAAGWSSNFLSTGTKLFFDVYTDDFGSEPWSADSTEATLVADVLPGPQGSQCSPIGVVNRRVVLRCYLGVGEPVLWITDGTAAGTRPLAPPQLLDAYASPGRQVYADGALLFLGYDGVHGNELWRTDGTMEGTYQVADINPGEGDSTASAFASSDDLAFLVAYDSAHGWGLWRTDGTEAGTIFLARGGRRTADSYPQQFGLLGDGSLAFMANDGVHGSQLWRMTAATAGVTQVSQIGNDGLTQGVSSLAVVDGIAYMAARDEAGVGTELWRSDGTPSGLQFVKDLDPGPGSGYPTSFFSAGGLVYFAASRAGSGRELWRTDGSEAGTALVKDINSGAADSSPYYLFSVGAQPFFSATNNLGAELWTTDGSDAGTRIVKDILTGAQGSYPTSGVNLGSAAVFTADDGIHGRELWVTDGSESGTRLLMDVRPGSASSSPSWLTKIDTFVYFIANDGVHGSELWKTDGTPSGTSLAVDLNPGPATGVFSIVRSGSILYLEADDGVTGRELWTSDGSTPGTVLVADLAPGPSSGLFGSRFYPYSGGVLFSRNQRLWQSDGTASGTVQVGGAFSDLDTSSTEVAEVGGAIVFRAREHYVGTELWAVGGCGDGSIDPNEECDDGNNRDGDCCSASCRMEIGACEDGDICTTGESCIDGACQGAVPKACGPCQQCVADFGCSPGPIDESSCKQVTVPGKSTLLLRDKMTDSSDVLSWTMSRVETTAPGDFGRPDLPGGNGLSLCIFDESWPLPVVALQAQIDAGGTCGSKACWKGLGRPAGSSGFRYSDPAASADGISAVLLRPGAAGKGSIVVKGRGEGLRMPGEPGAVFGPLPLDPSFDLRVQLETNGQCWQAMFSQAGVKVNRADQFKGASD